jgi:gliding motility-associated-like protein
MRLHPRHITLLLACVIAASRMLAQIVVTPTTGCAPLAVSFSGPAGATAASWTIAPGQSSTLSTLSHLYANAGTYNITYTALVGGNPVSHAAQVVVTPGPTGSFNFTIPPTHCLPMAVQFSGTGGSPGSTVMWAFGDLTPLVNGSNVTHTYTMKGSFVPSMVIIDAVSGCTAIANSAGTINVSAPPTLLIASSGGFGSCTPPLVTQINGASSISGSPLGGGLQNVSWSFGGGSPGAGTGLTPGTVTFPTGTHTITLSATDNNNCSGTTQAVVSVISPTLWAATQGTICPGNTVQLTVYSSEPTYLVNSPHSWDPPMFIGINSLSMTTSQIYTLGVPGITIYTVTIQPSGCAPITVTASAFVEIVVANFTSTPPSSTCDSVFIVNYVNLSTTNTSLTLNSKWELDGGGGYNNGFNSPIFTHNAQFTITQGSTNPYTLYKHWVPLVVLRVTSTSTAQCSANVRFEVHDTIQRVTAWFVSNKQEGCGPLTVTYSDSSFTLESFGTPVYPITGYTFHTGGSPPTIMGNSSIFPITITYPANGIYHPWMAITTGTSGCNDVSFHHTITVVDPPAVSLTYTPSLTACAGAPVQVNMTSTTTTVNHWHVSSDNGFFSHCVNQSNPIGSFSHVGTHGFTISAYDHSCENTTPTTQTISIKGPYAKFRFRTYCDVNSRKNVDFDMHLQEVQTATLNYGDGSLPMVFGSNPTGILSQAASHAYQSTGNYSASLVVSNGLTSCPNRTFTQVVTIRELEAAISNTLGAPLPALPAPLLCSWEPTRFSGMNSAANLVGCRRGFIWDLDGPPGTDFPPEQREISTYLTDTLKITGIYTIQLVVFDENGCSDTARTQFRVSDVVMDFTVSSNPVCLSDGTVKVVNNVGLNPADQAILYIWNFGDGSPQLTTSNGTPVHTYSNASSPYTIYYLSGKVTNNAGCEDTSTIAVKVNNPYPNFQTYSVFPCIPLNGSRFVPFTANPGYVTYSVSYDDPPWSPPQWITASTFTNTGHNFNQPGIYVPTLTVKDDGGCTATETRTIHALGQPTAVIKFPDNTNKFCYPATPSIVSMPSLYQTKITNQLWTINGISTQPPGSTTLPYIFSKVGITNIALTVDTAFLCPHTATAQVFIFDPKANITLSKYKFCLGDTLTATIVDSSGSVETIQWFMGDFVPHLPMHVHSTQAKIPVIYKYNIFPSDSLGKTTVALRYTGLYGTCTRSAQKDIQVIKVDASFRHTSDQYRHCLKIPDEFTGTSRNPAGHGLAFEWNFGDQNGGSGQTIGHTFASPGTYSVKLTVRETEFNCAANAARNMTILPLPVAGISVTPETVCPQVPFELHASGKPGEKGSLTGTLIPSAGNFSFSPQNTFTVTSSVSLTTTYSLTVTDENTCESEPASALVKIPDLAPAVHWDTTVIVGRHVPINVYAGSPNYTYSWTPVLTDLSCTTCVNPVSTTTNDITYTVVVTDAPLACFSIGNTYSIRIRLVSSLDVPSAFTPNGDGMNDFIHPDGWGLHHLNYFRVYNRWGQLLYETNESRRGWDGQFQGVPQNMETYVWQASGVGYNQEVITKSGTFKLLR